ncbi:MAG TPA: LysR family transcriptional regulator [Steroidobacteraceae bacterium]|nr:LysR family transcriptional regulator [Steroidobacteraceae bacterium]
MDLLEGLRTFTRIAETGSFSAVAREHNASHSAVTRQVGQLEEHFGVRLFHRTTRRLSLTEDGQDLLGYARTVLEATEEMEGSLGRQRSSPTGVVRLGIPVAATPWLVPRIGELLREHPGLVVQLVIGDRIGDMIEDRLDVALIGRDLPDNSLISRSVGSFGRIAVASAAYLEQYGAPSVPQDLMNHRCIIHDIGPDSARWRFGPPDNLIEVNVPGALWANNSEVVHRAALAGHGIARLSELQAADDIRAARLYRLLPDFLPERQQIYVVYPSRRHLPPRVRVTIDFVAEGVRRLMARLESGKLWGENESAWLV